MDNIYAIILDSTSRYISTVVRSSGRLAFRGDIRR